jgi:hypothetical protein
MHRISKQDSVKVVEPSYAVSVRDFGQHRNAHVIDATGKGITCEICGQKTHSVKSKNKVFYCKECFSADIIRERQKEFSNKW